MKRRIIIGGISYDRGLFYLLLFHGAIALVLLFALLFGAASAHARPSQIKFYTGGAGYSRCGIPPPPPPGVASSQRLCQCEFGDKNCRWVFIRK